MYLSRRLFSSSSSSSLSFRKVGVVGLGLMGHGVAQVVAQAGFQVIAIESNVNALNTGMKRIEGSLGKVITKDVSKGVITEVQGKEKYNQIMSRLTGTTTLNDAHDCDLIIEAIAENMDLKLNFYKNLGSIVQPDCVFASNTSSLAITNMGLASGRPAKFVGLHFFNPVQMMKLVEVVKTAHTSPEVFDAMMAFSKTIGKKSVACRDTPGFIVNRLLVPYVAQAMAMYGRGDASIPDIDVSMQLGTGHPMGPLHLSDYIGLDTIHHILVGWAKDFPNEPAFFVPPILDELVKRGDFGRKTGKGFYNWDGDKVLTPAL